MSSLLIKNATIVNEGLSFKGDLLVKDEYIEHFGTVEKERIPAGTRIIEASGLLLIPGVIDDHVHFREPGLTHKGDIFTESKAAASGGVTSFMDMPNTVPQSVSVSSLEGKYILASEHSIINYSFYIGATNTNLDEIMKADPGKVCGIKLFIGSSTGNMLVDDENTLRNIFSGALMPVACHCEDEQIIRNNTEKARLEYGDAVPFKLHPLIRSREACLRASTYMVKLAEEYDTRLHLLHLSTAEEIMLLNARKTVSGKRITGEVCVHYLWFDDSAYEELGSRVKWNPSIKTRSDRDALRKAVNDNLIDIIATDHAPHTLEEKSNSYFKAPSGGPLIQHSLVAMLELWHNKIFTIEKLVEKMCHNPAIVFNIKERGFIRKGYKADLCLINPLNPWKVSKDNILYKCGWSPFDGVTFRSKVLMTIVNGTVVYDDGEVDETYRGQRLQFDRRGVNGN